MKTLYINVNGVDIQSSEDVCVVGKPEDSIVNKFYYELGKEILKGVDVSVTSDINKKGIITAFMGHDKESYDAIWKEWEKVKDKLLGENPTGPHKVTLSSEYISWLNNNSQTVYSEIAKSLHSKDGVVEISIDKIYRNAIGILVNSIEPSNCKQFVVNDRSVTDDSQISLDIMERVKGIAFVSYDDIVCPQCGKFLCECKQDPVCPKCGKSPCECITDLPICPNCGRFPCECNSLNGNDKVLLVVVNANNKHDDFCEFEILDIEMNSLLKLLKVRGRIKERIRKNSHDFIIFEEDKPETPNRFDIITVDTIEQSLSLDEIEHRFDIKTIDSIARRLVLGENGNNADDYLSSEELRKLERFFPQYIGGLDFIGKSGEDYLLYGYKEEMKDCFSADVIISTGEILFTLQKDDRIVVRKVLQSGLILMEKCENDGTSHYGIADKHGNLLLQCVYEAGAIYEIQPGIVRFNDTKFYINAYTKEKYVDVAGEYALRIKIEDNDSLIDIICLKNGEIIKKDVIIDSNPNLMKLGHGWCLVDILERNKRGRVDKVSMVFCQDNHFCLDTEETILRISDDGLINNNRIITIVSHGNRIRDWKDFTNIPEMRIRDYNGNIIKTIMNPQLYVIGPYHFGKLAAFGIRKDGIARTLCYFDMQGDKYVIPCDLGFFHFSNLQARFVSETTLVVTNGKRGNCILIDIEGNILFNLKNTFFLQ